MTKARKAGLVALATGGLLLGGAGAASAAEAPAQSLLSKASELGVDAETVVPGMSTISKIPVVGGITG